MSFFGQNPKLVQYSKRKSELCKDYFIHKVCTRGEYCHFSHKAPPINENWKKSFCPKFYDGTCQRGTLCNFKHHPNYVRNPVKKLSGKDLILELRRLNPYGYNEEKSVSPPEIENVEEIRKKRLERMNDVTQKVGKVQLRYE